MKKICILGTGVSGSILASELSKRHCITVVDCDSLDSPFDKDLNLKKCVDSDLKKQKTTGYGFGGTTNLWHGVLTCLEEEDIQIIDKMTGSCISCDFNQYAQRLERYFGNLSFLRSKNIGGSKLEPFLSLNLLNVKRYVHMVRPARFRKIIKRLRGRVNAVECSVAVSLNVDNNSDTIKSVRVSQNGKQRDIFADIFIVATGGLESPRLLLQSFENSKHSNSMIGKGLMDHPHMTIGNLTIPKYIFYTQHGTRSMLFSNSSRIGYTIPKDYRHSKDYNHSIYVRPSLVKDIDTVRCDIKSLVGERLSLKTFFKMLSRPSLLLSAFVLLSERFGFGMYTNTFNIHMHLEQSVDGKSSVTLSRGVDQHGRRIPKVYRDFSDDIFRSVLNMQKLLENLTVHPGVFDSTTVEKCSLDSGAHFSGTCRLGTDKSRSVVDKNLKYHSVENLFICDASVIPKTGNSNLSLTIASFALRLSDHLNNRNHGKN